MSVLVSTQPLTIARDRNGSHVYLYKGQGVQAEALDPDDAKRLVDEGFLEKRDADKPAKAEPAEKPKTAKKAAKAPAKKAASSGAASSNKG